MISLLVTPGFNLTLSVRKRSCSAITTRCDIFTHCTVKMLFKNFLLFSSHAEPRQRSEDSSQVELNTAMRQDRTSSCKLGDYGHFQSSYNITKVLHKGTYGTVFCAQHKQSGQRVAVKVIKLRREYMDAVKREIELSTRLRHPSIVKTLGVYRHAEQQKVLIVQDYAAGGDLFEYLISQGAIKDEKFVKKVFTDLCSALLHMHDVVGACHRDVKPENVLLVPPEPMTAGEQERLPGIRLTDFGLSQYSSVVNKDLVKGIAGTQGFISPEVASLPPNGQGRSDGRAADVWSLGVTMFTVVMASLPWNVAGGTDPFYRDYIARRRAGALGAVFGYDSTAPQRFTPQFLALMDRMLDPNPKERIKLHDALEYANQPWLACPAPEYGVNESEVFLDLPQSSSLSNDRDDGRQQTPRTDHKSSDLMSQSNFLPSPSGASGAVYRDGGAQDSYAPLLWSDESGISFARPKDKQQGYEPPVKDARVIASDTVPQANAQTGLVVGPPDIVAAGA